jgi:manganese transport protein
VAVGERYRSVQHAVLDKCDLRSYRDGHMAVMPAVPLGTAAPPQSSDPYLLTPDAIEAPPTSVADSLRRVGPGMVLAAAIVGSGELIATTTLGAQVGFAALWIILVSCVIKPVVQAELGRYTIATGHTGLEGFDRVPGPRLGVSWLVWAWGITVALTLLQIGGMYGGVAQVLHLLAPAIPLNMWVGICLLLTIGILLGGGYERIEKLAIVKVGFFTMLTICAAAVLLRSDAMTPSDLAGGLSLQLPAAGLATAIAVFGMTGVGATELVQYPYWCVEKGYARFVGPRDGSAAWTSRLDPRDAPRHLVLARDLHVGDGRFLPARRRCAAPDGRGAGGA